MCGIFGYVGPRDPVPIIMSGLRSLEYRGYDSAGIAIIRDQTLTVRRCSGKLKNLEDLLAKKPVSGQFGLGHTRWATHGRPTEENAHPHRDCKGRIVVAHNGIIENYLSLKRKLLEEGHKFTTETDTEVIAHLIEKHFAGNLEEAVVKTLAQLKGLFAFTCVSADDPQKIVAVREGAPIVVGSVDGEGFVASDVPAVLPYTRSILFLDEHEVAVVARDGIRLLGADGKAREPKFNHITWDPIMAEKGGYKHFMLKEIYEQPTAIGNTVLGRYSLDTSTVHLEDAAFTEDAWKSFGSVRILACGTSWHAALAGKYMIESLARLPVDVDYASEYRYRNPVVLPGTLYIFITQSGETADTVAAQRQVRESGSTILTITNVVGSMTTRVADAVLYTRAGPEIGVASTKAFTTQLACLYLVALHLAKLHKTMADPEMRKALTDLTELPHKMEMILENAKHIEDMSKALFRHRDFLFLARGIHFPIALEGALKLKELSYIHAEGYPAGEMKHGPNALIDENLPVVFLGAYDPSSPESHQRYEKVLNNIKEVKSRDGIIVSVGNENETDLIESSDHFIGIPPANEFLLPILEVIPLQLLAYHCAVRRGCDIDQPRNLAKSVTVE
ncbi:MAG: glutamine--fructose-6-phosphate transaminase (isomerizing) [Acidobacteria bacterium]|nr:glutamine--fructose-6-phosphate transaminase (isomerizing) [Acidobacteriota bacterium]